MTWLADAADRLAGGREDRCAHHDTHRMEVIDVCLADHLVDDVPRIDLGWHQPVYLGDSVEGYCPADQEVSRSISSQGVWEGFGSCLAAQLLHCDRATVVDFGANVGWYTNLAGAFGHDVLAVDADIENIAAIEAGWWTNDWTGELAACRGWIGQACDVLPAAPIRLVKADIEGAEASAVAVLLASLTEGSIDFMLMEVTPMMGSVDYLDTLQSCGMRGYVLPDKRYPPDLFADDPLGATMDWGPLAAHTIERQADVLFIREGLL